METKIVRFRKGEKGIMPITGIFSAPDVEATEDCLAIFPGTHDRSGFILTDKKLKELGYEYVGKDPIKYYKFNGEIISVDTDKENTNWIAKDNSGVTTVHEKKPFYDSKFWTSTGRSYVVEDYVLPCGRKSLRKLYDY